MKRRLIVGVIVLVALVGAGLAAIRGIGVSARPQPSAVEVQAARFLRSWMTPSTYKGLPNPVALTPDVLASAREHFADHCASCHANNGSGDTEMGRGLYPKSPDLRNPRTQGLSDGELFYFIENGVKLTGMPAWSNGTPEGETASWQLVHFIRHLPSMTPDEEEEMKRFNPVSRAEIEEEQAINDFLGGGDPPPPADPHAGHKQ